MLFNAVDLILKYKSNFTLFKALFLLKLQDYFKGPLSL